MPDYSEYIIIKNNSVKFYNHRRGDYTFLCDMLWGEEEARRIIGNQPESIEFKSDNPFSRIIINEYIQEVSFQIGIPEDEHGAGILMIEKYLELVRKTWKGWKITYLTGGYDDVLDILGMRALFGADALQNQIPDYTKNAWDEPQTTLLSIELNGEVSFDFVPQNIADLVVEGEGLVNRTFKGDIPSDRLPYGGLHVVVDKKIIYLWYAVESFKLKEWVSQYYPGWIIDVEFFGYERHYHNIGKLEVLRQVKHSVFPIALKWLKEAVIEEKREPCFIEGKGYSFCERMISEKERNEKLKEIMGE